MQCKKKKTDQAIDELIAVGGMTKSPQYRPGTRDRTSNLYELVLTERSDPYCSSCGHTEKDGCKCMPDVGRRGYSAPDLVSKWTPRGIQMEATSPPNGHHPGLQMDIAEEEPCEEEQFNKNHLASLCDTSQAKVSGEDQVIQYILQGRSLPRQLPCEKLQFVRMMQQMSRDCFRGEELDRITQTNYNEVKRYCKEIATSLLLHNRPVDPAYLYAFCFYYEGLDFDHVTPKPVSYAKYWDDEDFWDSDYHMGKVNEYRDALLKDPKRPLMCHYVWTVAS
jgi:hypothetical protein